MTPRPKTVLQDAMLLEALDIMVSQRVHQLPVVDGTGALVGILSDRDLKAALPDRFRPRQQFEEALRSIRVQEVMSHEPLTVTSSTPVLNAIAVILSCQVGALPVVDQGDLVGILSKSDLLRELAAMLSEDAGARNEETSSPSIVRYGSESSFAARIFVVTPDPQARPVVTSALLDAGFAAKSFEDVSDMMMVWQLVLPDLLILDRGLGTEPNLPLLLRGGTPHLWLERKRTGYALSDPNGDVLVLPSPDEQLRHLVQRIVALGRTTRPERDRPRVLIAEDDHVIRRILTHHLGRSGYELCEAHDGREASELLTERSFDLLLLDINMPFRSGLDILRQLRRSQDRTKRVILSAAHQDETVLEAFQLGAHDFVKKPFDPEILVRRLNRLMERT